MYKVMIVDDETIIHQGLKVCLDWRSLDCEIIHDACDGIDALEKLERETPDIILTDIKMPGMDGLAFAKHISERYPAIQVIMLTGFADIDYARKAMDYNVKSFILKPTETDEIQKALEKAIAYIRQEKEQAQRIRELEEMLAQNRIASREKLLGDILHGAINDDTHLRQSAQHVNLHLDAYLLLAAQIEEGAGIQPEPSQSFLKDKATDRIFLVDTMLKNAFQPQLQYNIILNQRALVSIIHTLSLPLEPQFTIGNIANTVEFLRHSLNVRLSVGVSAIHHGVESLQVAYREADHALQQRFFESEERYVFLYDATIHPPEMQGMEIVSLKRHLDGLLDAVERQDEAAMQKAMIEFFQEHADKKAFIDTLKNDCIYLCSLCANATLTKLAGREGESQIDPYIYQQIIESRTLLELQQIMLTYLTHLFHDLPEQRREMNYLIQKAQNVIRHHYRENISLQTIADAVFVNASYLSRLFRKETGVTITEAILQVRMEKAKELLRTSHSRIKEIARDVGYEDESYFSRNFKEYTSMNPKTYKDTYRQFPPHDPD